MKKCDFCTQSTPEGKCYWRLQAARERDCEKAIKKMTEALKGADDKKKGFSDRRMSMTENEAINELKDYRACSGTELPTEIEVAIKALEEIQQYRAIGTVDQCSKAMDIVKTMIERDMEPVEMEVLQAYIHFENELVDKGFTVKSLLEAAERMKPKKPLLSLCGDCQRGCTDCDRYEDRCPTCNGGLYIESGKPHKHCPHCGQKLEWSE